MPYTDSPATALGVLEGRVIAPSRDEMETEFATTKAVPQPDLEAQDLTALIAATAADLHRAITGNSLPTTELAARVAAVVTAHTALRDAYLRLSIGHELAAGRVWTHIAAHHRGRIRAELLTMAAVSYYCGEDTVRTGMALTYAAEATRDDDSTLPRLATIIYSALQAGMPPSRSGPSSRTVALPRYRAPHLAGPHRPGAQEGGPAGSCHGHYHWAIAAPAHSHKCTPTSHARTISSTAKRHQRHPNLPHIRTPIPPIPQP